MFGKFPAVLRLQCIVDGGPLLSLFKSYTPEFWPVMRLIRSSQVQSFVVKLYCGKKKPISLDNLLQDFIADLKLPSIYTVMKR
jgi:hypothetical protein